MSIGTVAANKSVLIVLPLEPIRMLMGWVVRVCWSEDNTAHESHRDRPCVSNALGHLRVPLSLQFGMFIPGDQHRLTGRDEGNSAREYRVRTVPSVNLITVLHSVENYARRGRMRPNVTNRTDH